MAIMYELKRTLRGNGETGPPVPVRGRKRPIMLGQLDHDAEFGFYSMYNRKPLKGFKARG